MAESTLSLTFAQIKTEIADYLGVKKADNATILNSIVGSGLRQFYNPPLTPGETTPYSWKFLKPSCGFATASGVAVYDMPDDFGFIEGDLTFAAGETYTGAISVVGEGLLRERYQQGNRTGVPRLGALRPKTTTGAEGQRWEILFYPIPDGTYNLTYRYNVLANKLVDTALEYPYGGMQHSETILQSCLAVAELRRDDEIGIHNAKFMERLIASIGIDKRSNPQYLGYNSDNSDRIHRGGGYVSNHNVTYNDILY